MHALRTNVHIESPSLKSCIRHCAYAFGPHLPCLSLFHSEDTSSARSAYYVVRYERRDHFAQIVNFCFKMLITIHCSSYRLELWHDYSYIILLHSSVTNHTFTQKTGRSGNINRAVDVPVERTECNFIILNSCACHFTNVMF